MKNTVEVDKKILSGLIELGAKGEPMRFQMQAKRLIAKLDRSEKRYASALIQRLPSFNTTREVPEMAQPIDTDSRLSLLKRYDSVVLESEPLLNPVTFQAITQVLKERSKMELLLSQDLTPTRTLLFEGAPGLGKTLSAKWIAQQLNLPLLVLDLATVMSSYLGKTGNNVRMVLDYASSFPCVLLLDEFDTIAKRRDDDKDVGELKRLVTVLLQTIEEWPASSVLIAATNHGALLDPAVWRRFDNVIHFTSPGTEIIHQFLKNNALEPMLIPFLESHFKGNSLSDIKRSINLIKKEALISDISQLQVIHRMYDVKSDPKLKKLIRNEEVIMLSKEGLSQRKISEIVSVSRPTIKNILEQFGGE